MLTTKILSVKFNVVTNRQAIEQMIKFLESEKNNLVFTPNPEVVMIAQKDKRFLNILNNADLLIPDGIGIVMASKLNKIKLSERVAGCDLTYELLERIKKLDYRVYLLGGKPGVCNLAKENIKKIFGFDVVGIHDGYFKEEDEKEIIKNINDLKTDILLVGLGVPRQEKFIHKYKNHLNTKICMGVGGTLDVISGTVSRAPLVFQKTGLEWFYRLLKQPERIIRVFQIPLFIIKVVFFKIKGYK